MNRETIKKAISSICEAMEENRDYLIQLDQQNGDGDLGVYMCLGFRAVEKYLEDTDETDLGKLMMKCGSAFNEAAPSSLGTILSFGFMGMAKPLKGKTDASFGEFCDAFEAGLDRIMQRAESKRGEKTVLDALCPAADALKASQDNPMEALASAARAAYEGSEATRTMLAVHGRAARYGEKSIGVLDGGSVAGMLIIQGIAKSQGVC
ncbi:MAG: dihydroxyacetone kinase subunit L [Clostridia bacterium]|nr:dihydroxyacetone kinase subunit L [Clostridia bacterium]